MDESEDNSLKTAGTTLEGIRTSKKGSGDCNNPYHVLFGLNPMERGKGKKAKNPSRTAGEEVDRSLEAEARKEVESAALNVTV